MKHPQLVTQLVRAALCTTLALLAALPAHAQYGGAGAGSGTPGGPRRGGDDGSITSRIERNRDAVRAEPLEQRLDDLRRRLGLAPEQVRAWDDLRAALLEFTPVRPRAVSASEIFGGPQVAQQQLTAASNIYTQTERLADAVKALYSKLSPGQQRTADEYVPQFISDVMSANLQAWPRPPVAPN
ncbi:hypothetical protein [Caenimonas koreensis]|uniref:LTXXQ motif family protein n=1 Tax=Caenimonas koreensis DSM 17982 TaxID=1121255 RepID=A0A844AZV2_9BURK|nr:hypothetical protein [Caenimonas koreensis]MRD46373.1 hypothetical protein [Caenimonas koreensis DSM 17982]